MNFKQWSLYARGSADMLAIGKLDFQKCWKQEHVNMLYFILIYCTFTNSVIKRLKFLEVHKWFLKVSYHQPLRASRRWKQLWGLHRMHCLRQDNHQCGRHRWRRPSPVQFFFHPHPLHLILFSPLPSLSHSPGLYSYFHTSEKCPPFPFLSCHHTHSLTICSTSHHKHHKDAHYLLLFSGNANHVFFTKKCGEVL